MKRYNAVDFLKMMAIICIVFHHYQQFTGYSFPGFLWIFNFFGGSFFWGYMVELFFVISGFFAGKTMERTRGTEFRAYIGKKYYRFFPMVLICDTIFVVLREVYQTLYPIERWLQWGGISEKFDLWTYISSIGLIRFGGVLKDDRGINSVTWMLCVLLICYIFHYAFVIIAQKTGFDSRYSSVIIILVALAAMEYGVKVPFLNAYSARGYMSFFSGILLGNYYLGNQERFRLKVTLRVMLFFVTFIGAVFSPGNSTGYVLSLISWPLVLSCFLDSTINEKVFSNDKLWRAVGRTEFEVYIWHPVITICFYIISALTGENLYNYGIKSMILYAAICLLTGFLAYELIECPLYKWLDGYKK